MERPSIEELRGCFREERKPRRKPPQWKTKKCERCGEEVSVLTRNTKYCEDCRKEVARERDRGYKQEEAKRGRPKKPPKPSKRASTIDATIKAAMAAGMSYGKYKAMQMMKGAV